MHVLVISKSVESTAGLVQSLRASGCEVHVAPKTDDIVRVVREIPLSAIFLQAAHGPEAERFRESIEKLHPGCRVVLIGKAAASPRGGEVAWILDDRDLSRLVRATTDAAPRDGDDRRVASLVQSLETVVSLLESEDPYFVGSTHRVTRIAEAVARRMGLSTDTVHEVVIASLLRDIGRVGLQAAIRESNAEFGESEALRMREHVVWSERLIAHIDFPWRVKALVRHHHERYDGSGYPGGLSAREIPVGARIVAAADSFVAMTSDRRHRPAKSFEAARDELMRSAGTQLDPEVVEHLLAVVADRREAGATGSKATIVIVDLDAAYRRLLRLRLLDEGVDVLLRDSIRDVEPLLDTHRPDLIAADLGADGVHGLDWLRGTLQAKGARVPVAVLSQGGDRNLRLQSLRYGIDDFIEKESDLEETVARIRNILLRRPERNAGGAEAWTPGLSGRLEAMGLPEVLQFLSMGAKTARVRLTGDDGATGEVWFTHGAITHAVCGDRSGREALFALLLFDTGDFRIEHGVTADARTVDGETTHLVLEGLRRKDESRAGREPDPTPTPSTP
jgi:HD-GYP domain-containing protein (c-di-GMP phosphodiesterase class II)